MLSYTTLSGSSLHPVPVTVSLEYQLMCLPRLELYITFLLEVRNLSYQSYFLIGAGDTYTAVQPYRLM